MSESMLMNLDTGPGSYEISESLGHLSQKYYNSPRTVIARAQKTNKLFMSVELNKQLSGLESPGVNTYNPKLDHLLTKNPSALFGKEQRTMSHIKPMLNRSPGPVYAQSPSNSGVKFSFTKARRNSTIEPSSPAPWDYNPHIPPAKIPDIIFKTTYERNQDKYLTPGPGTYKINESSWKTRGAYVSKVGRNIVGSARENSPGPGSYNANANKHLGKIGFGSSARNFDPRLYAKSWETYRD